MTLLHRRTFLGVATGTLAAAAAQAQSEALPNRPKVPGTLRLNGRRRDAQGGVSEQILNWDVAKTAIIICDMWDTHTCSMAAQRVGVMAPRMNAAVSAARSHGVMIIHAPSDTMKFYEGTPWRKRMQAAPKVESPIAILARCPRDPAEERSFPIDDTVSACDDPIIKKWTGPYPWKRQHPALDILGFDGVSDNGQEIYNFCKQEGIHNIAIMGVHTNICILNRSFGIRQFTQLGFQVALTRDLTDAMYDPRERPYVSHARGTELVIEHIEAKFCPSILSEDLTRVVAHSDGPSN